jgi:hypothetical protein
VATNASPTVSLTSPASGAEYIAPASIALTATASDPDGSVTQVEFYQGSTLIGSDATSPYSVTWNNVPTGTYSLTAVARDNQGAMTVSAGRDIAVVVEHVSPVVGTVVFAPSDDDTEVDSYVLEIFSASTGLGVPPIVAQDLGRPTMVLGEYHADIAATIASLPPGAYVATISAVNQYGSGQSTPSAPFTR